MSFVKFYVCDPKLNTTCKGRFAPYCGSKDFCYSTTRPECAKKNSNGEPIIDQALAILKQLEIAPSTVIEPDSEEADL